MQDLIGNGRPGRVDELEKIVLAHQKLIWMGMGVIIAFQIAGFVLHFTH
jgi:hypothetical protein